MGNKSCISTEQQTRPKISLIWIDSQQKQKQNKQFFVSILEKQKIYKAKHKITTQYKYAPIHTNQQLVNWFVKQKRLNISKLNKYFFITSLSCKQNNRMKKNDIMTAFDIIRTNSQKAILVFVVQDIEKFKNILQVQNKLTCQHDQLFIINNFTQLQSILKKTQRQFRYHIQKTKNNYQAKKQLQSFHKQFPQQQNKNNFLLSAKQKENYEIQNMKIQQKQIFADKSFIQNLVLDDKFQIIQETQKQDQLQKLFQALGIFTEGNNQQTSQIFETSKHLPQFHKFYPFNLIGRVISIFTDFYTQQYHDFPYGTGTLLSNRLVLTVAHNMYHPKLKKAAKHVFFQYVSPKGQKRLFRVIRYGIHSEYFNTVGNKNSQSYDLALLILQQNDLYYKNFNFQIPLKFDYEHQKYKDNLILISGFPKVKYYFSDRFIQYYDIKKGNYQKQNFLLYKHDLHCGHSGSPVFLLQKNQSKKGLQLSVIGVHKGAKGNGKYCILLNYIKNQLVGTIQMIYPIRRSKFMIQKTESMTIKQFQNKIFKETKHQYSYGNFIQNNFCNWSLEDTSKNPLQSYLTLDLHEDSFFIVLKNILIAIKKIPQKYHLVKYCVFEDIISTFQHLSLDYIDQNFFFICLKDFIQYNLGLKKRKQLLLTSKNTNPFQIQYFRKTVNLQNQQIFNAIFNDQQICNKFGSTMYLVYGRCYNRTKQWMQKNNLPIPKTIHQNHIRIKQNILRMLEDKENCFKEINLEQRQKNQYKNTLSYFMENNNFQKASVQANKITNSQQNEDPDTLLLKAQAMQKIGEYDIALQFYKQFEVKLLSKAQQMGNPSIALSGICQLYKQIASVLVIKKQYLEASLYYQKCSQNILRLYGEEDLHYGFFLQELGHLYQIQRKSSQALKIYKKCLDIFDKNLAKSQVVGLNYMMAKRGKLNYKLGNYKLSILFYESCLKQEQSMFNYGRLETVEYLQGLAKACDKQNRVYDAINYFQRCLIIIQRFKGKNNMESANILLQLGQLYRVVQDYNEQYPSQYGKKNKFALNLKQQSFYIQSQDIIVRIKGKQTIEYAKATSKLGLVYELTGQKQLALKLLLEAYKIYQKQRVKKQNIYFQWQGQTNMIESIGQIYCQNNQVQKGLQFYLKTSNRLVQIYGADCYQSVKLLIKIAIVYQALGNLSKSIQYLQKSIRIQQSYFNDPNQHIKNVFSIPTFTHESYLQDLLFLGLKYQQIKNYPQIVKIYKKCLKLKQQELNRIILQGNLSRIIKQKQIQQLPLLQCIGLFNQILNYHNEAFIYYKRYLDLKFKYNLEFILQDTSVLDYVGIQQNNQSQNYEKAKCYLQKSLSIREAVLKSQDFQNYVTLQALAKLYLNVKQYNNFLIYSQRCLQLLANHSQQKVVLYAAHLNDIGIAYKQLKDYQKSLKYYINSMEKFQSIGDLIDMIVVMKNIEQIYAILRDNQNRLKYMLLITNLYQKLNNKQNNLDYIKCLKSIAQIEFQRQNFEKSLLYYTKCLQLLQKQKKQNNVQFGSDNKQLGSIYQSISLNYQKLGKQDKAKIFIQKYQQLRKSMKQQLNI